MVNIVEPECSNLSGWIDTQIRPRESSGESRLRKIGSKVTEFKSHVKVKVTKGKSKVIRNQSNIKYGLSIILWKWRVPGKMSWKESMMENDDLDSKKVCTKE